jgi:hypothetical protein
MMSQSTVDKSLINQWTENSLLSILEKKINCAFDDEKELSLMFCAKMCFIDNNTLYYSSVEFSEICVTKSLPIHRILIDLLDLVNRCKEISLDAIQIHNSLKEFSKLYCHDEFSKRIDVHESLMTGYGIKEEMFKFGNLMHINVLLQKKRTTITHPIYLLTSVLFPEVKYMVSPTISLSPFPHLTCSTNSGSIISCLTSLPTPLISVPLTPTSLITSSTVSFLFTSLSEEILNDYEKIISLIKNDGSIGKYKIDMMQD